MYTEIKALHPNEEDAGLLWAEIIRLRAALEGPEGVSSWQEAATAERVRRVKAEQALAAEKEAQEKQEPVGTLTIQRFRGHLENTEFDYVGSLPDGSYPLYLHPQPVAPRQTLVVELPDECELESWRQAADDLLRTPGRTVREAAFKLQNAYLFARKLVDAQPVTPQPVPDYSEMSRDALERHAARMAHDLRLLMPKFPLKAPQPAVDVPLPSLRPVTEGGPLPNTTEGWLHRIDQETTAAWRVGYELGYRRARPLPGGPVAVDVPLPEPVGMTSLRPDSGCEPVFCADQLRTHREEYAAAVLAAQKKVDDAYREEGYRLVSDKEYLRLFERARNGSDRPAGILRGVRACIAAYEMAAQKGTT